MGLLPASRRLRRLRAAVEVRGEWTPPKAAPPDDPRIGAIKEHLGKADKAADEGRINEGWGHLHEAERLQVTFFDGPELEATVLDLRKEAADSKKFRAWRRNAILQHLSTEGGRKVTAADVQHALRLRTEHFDNVYDKIDETLSWVQFASTAVVLLLVALLFGGGMGWFPLGADSLRLLGTAIVMGALGGALSTGLTLAQAEPRKPIPDTVFAGAVTAFRPILGGAAAAVTFVFLKAGLLDFLTEGVAENVWLVASFAFLAGFSERWFLGIIDKLTKDREEAGDKPEAGAPAPRPGSPPAPPPSG